MGKRKKRKRQKGPNKTAPIEVLEKKASDALQARKYRQARDYLKELCKRDREKYLPELIAAHEGLALQMINEGRFSDAKQVVDHLTDLGATGKKGWLEFIVSFKQGDFVKAACAALRLLEEDDNITESGEKLLMYDSLVLSFEALDIAKTPKQFSIIREANQVQAALKLVSEEKYEEAMACLRAVSLSSPFSHWKLFVKGLIAFYKMEEQKAQKAFSKLPDESIPAKAAEPYMLLLGSREGLKKYQKRADVLGLACWVAARKDLESVLPRAEYLWRVGRFRDSYAHVRRNIEGFPSEDQGIIQGLSDFYLNAVFQMKERDADRYIDFLDKMVARGKTDGAEKLMILRTIGLWLEDVGADDPMVLGVWKEFLRWHREVHGENRDLQALVCVHLGDLFSREVIRHPPFFPFSGGATSRRPVVHNERLAQYCYDTCLEIDPTNKQAHFSLLALYEKTGQKSKINKKLDEIIELFPEDKDTLYKAGLRCVDRKAFIKGMKYLEWAAKLDLLDMRVREALIVCCIKAALEYAKRSKVEQYRALLSKALEYGESDSDDFNLGHAYLYARWATFELLNNNVTDAEQLLDKASELGRHEPRFLYFKFLVGRLYQVPSKYMSSIEKRVKKEFSGRASPEKAIAFADVISYFQRTSRTIPKWFKEEQRRVNRYIRKTAKGEFSQAQARVFVEYALQNTDEDLAWSYINKALEQNPDDPYFLFVRFQLEVGSFYGFVDEEELDELKRILSLAQKQRDQELISRIRKTIEEIEKMGSVRDIFDNHDEELDEEEEDLDEAVDIFVENLLREANKKRPGRQRKKRNSPSSATQLNLFD
ncbi:MAG: hypothetical protein DRH11_03355 [Deltaproteobacteria bacterium]|nr:MAG: hypothetical protein DRH11_03355 [Deltaproteobacteria bacterium]